MIEQNVTKEALLQTLKDGWFPAFFAVEDSNLYVEVCCNWRLGDGKFFSLRCPIGSDADSLTLIDELTQKGKSMWADEMEKLRKSAKEDAIEGS